MSGGGDFSVGNAGESFIQSMETAMRMPLFANFASR